MGFGVSTAFSSREDFAEKDFKVIQRLAHEKPLVRLKITETH